MKITFETSNGRTFGYDKDRNFVGAVRRTNCPLTDKASYHAKLAGESIELDFSTLPAAKKFVEDVHSTWANS